MKKGFTILELLVASLLLGMLVTILTMIFNQSSIAWRTGEAGVANLDQACESVAEVREEADTVYIWENNIYRLVSPWDDRNGNLRTRAVLPRGDAGATVEHLDAVVNKDLEDILKGDGDGYSVDSVDGGATRKPFTVNVKSAGPNRKFDDYDDIWSFPDDFD